MRSGGSAWLTFFVALVAATIVNLYYVHAYHQYERYGIQTTATIVDKRIEIEDKVDGEKRIYWVKLEYEVGLRTHRVETKVTNVHFRSVKRDDTVPLRYLSHTPLRFEYPQNYNRDWAIYSQIFALILGIGWLVSTWTAGKWVVHAVLARRIGRHYVVPVSGLYRLSKKDGDEKDDSKTKHQLLWREPNGGLGKSLPAEKQQFDGYAKGDEIIIFVFKGKSYWRGDVGDRIPRLSPIPRVKRR